ncbi:hypothetical protein HDV05_001274 [Chytridiales sp. JEL 0842]|nr:hypothetical protein HDV05_001274 [Chytridiales sp. JEL 0842]
MTTNRGNVFSRLGKRVVPITSRLGPKVGGGPAAASDSKLKGVQDSGVRKRLGPSNGSRGGTAVARTGKAVTVTKNSGPRSPFRNDHGGGRGWRGGNGKKVPTAEELDKELEGWMLEGEMQA